MNFSLLPRLWSCHVPFIWEFSPFQGPSLLEMLINSSFCSIEIHMLGVLDTPQTIQVFGMSSTNFGYMFKSYDTNLQNHSKFSWQVLMSKHSKLSYSRSKRYLYITTVIELTNNINTAIVRLTFYYSIHFLSKSTTILKKVRQTEI